MNDGCKDRLDWMLDLICHSKNWTRVRLAKELGRDRSRLAAANGDPKLSYLFKLADLLEWPVDMVVRCIREGFDPEKVVVPRTDLSFEEEYDRAYTARITGEYQDAIKYAQVAQVCEASPHNIARALNIEFTAWESLGLYTPANRCIRRAIAMQGTSEMLQYTLRSNLALCMLGQSDLTTADALAESAIHWFEDQCPTPLSEISLGCTHYAHAAAHRRLAARYPDRMQHHMQIAAGEFAAAESVLGRMAEELGRSHLGGIANTCRGGRLEAEAALGTQPARVICEQMIAEIDAGLAGPNGVRGDWLESYGWWTVGGGNIALRHLRGQLMQDILERLADQAIAIARQMDNWAFRERALSMEHALRMQIASATGYSLRASINRKDVRWITGTMGRFPNFHQTGWEILQDARLVNC